jgi:RNA 2',3'-cyclic 3'-phosphodiesterase
MKRTFFAVDIRPDESLTAILQDIRNHLEGEKIKWVTSDLMHLTLKFLGDTPEESIRQIINAADLSVRQMPVMNLHLSAVGLFKNLHNPRVIWIGIKPCPLLEQAVQTLGNTLVPFGYTADNVEFIPHLTLGRVKEIKHTEKLAGLIEEYKNESFGTVCISEIIYYESMLKPEGPVYHPLAHFLLRD